MYNLFKFYLDIKESETKNIYYTDRSYSHNSFGPSISRPGERLNLAHRSRATVTHIIKKLLA